MELIIIHAWIIITQARTGEYCAVKSNLSHNIDLVLLHTTLMMFTSRTCLRQTGQILEPETNKNHPNSNPGALSAQLRRSHFFMTVWTQCYSSLVNFLQYTFYRTRTILIHICYPQYTSCVTCIIESHMITGINGNMFFVT